jgi:hypothetical protein
MGYCDVIVGYCDVIVGYCVWIDNEKQQQFNQL